VALAALLLVVLFVALLAYGLTTTGVDTTIDSRLSESRAPRAPAFELPVLQQGAPGRELRRTVTDAAGDGTVALAELRGRPVVVNFWASWCPPCRTEAPLLERRWRRGRGGGVVFLGLNMQDLTGDARDFIDEFDISYLNVRDKGNDVATEWGVSALPETFFVDARGRVVGHVVGAISRRQLAAGIAASRAGRVLGQRSGGESRPTR
jgi:cytochrome c biogenesis protein CcmG/thiol:disulfide interchange protein DsbE